jgi:hypothetical protein
MNLRTLLIASMLVSCTQGPINVPEVIQQCTPVESLRGTVTELLRGRDWRDSMQDLVSTEGASTVFCVVQDIQRQLSKTGASASADFDPAVLAAANAYLAENPQ